MSLLHGDFPLQWRSICYIPYNNLLWFCADFPSSIKCWNFSRADFKKLNEILLIAPWEDIIAASPTQNIALTNIIDIVHQSAFALVFPLE